MSVGKVCMVAHGKWARYGSVGKVSKVAQFGNNLGKESG